MTAAPPPLDVQLAAAIRDPRLMRAGAALHANDLPVAERLLKAHLHDHPFEVTAMRMLAEVAARLRRYADAERLLVRALELQPGFRAARLNLASVLQRTEKIDDAAREARALLAADPDDPAALAVAAAIHVRRGEFTDALTAYRRLLERFPDHPQWRLGMGHVLKTLGRQDEAVAAYRQAVELAPSFGEAWWSLANLKTVRFAAVDRETMERALAVAERVEDRLHLHFALGKALEDAQDHAPSFAHYRAGNRLRRAQLGDEIGDLGRVVDRSIERLTAAAFAARTGGGDPAADPIFVVGLPRSGSTLLEQILASHPMIEGTAELPHIPAIVRDLARDGGGDDPRYVDRLLELSAEQRTALGRQYLDRSAVQRKTDRPFFIDKLPNNFAHVGLIRLILPNARIIDARRDAMATCFSCYKQHFARGQEFTYDLGELGGYYADYLRLMAHYDRVLPGAVHRVEHERLLDDLDGEVRAMLIYCEVPFDPACLDFHKTERPVRTASSAQVRRPLTREAVDQWRHYATWLAPLRDALAGVRAEPASPA